MKFKLFILAAALLLGALTAHAETNTFPKPKAGPYRVDWCLKWGAACGKPAADRYCKSRGYDTSTDFDIAENIGALNPPVATVVQSTGQICNGPQCDGFAQITCMKGNAPPGPSKTLTFVTPKHMFKLVDYCMKINMGGKGCGQIVADKFCIIRGFDVAVNFSPTPPLPYGFTRSLATDKVCMNGVCRGFQTITCAK